MLNNWSIFMQSYLKSVNYQNFYKNIQKMNNNGNNKFTVFEKWLFRSLMKLEK